MLRAELLATGLHPCIALWRVHDLERRLQGQPHATRHSNPRSATNDHEGRGELVAISHGKRETGRRTYDLGDLLHLRVRELAPDEALGGVERVLRVGDDLALGRSAHQPLTTFRDSHDGRRRARAFTVFNDTGSPTLHDLWGSRAGLMR